MRMPPQLETDPPVRGAVSTGASATIPSRGGVTVSWADPDEPLPPSSVPVDRDVLLSWKRQALSDIVSDLQWRVASLLDEVERTPVR